MGRPNKRINTDAQKRSVILKPYGARVMPNALGVTSADEGGGLRQKARFAAAVLLWAVAFAAMTVNITSTRVDPQPWLQVARYIGIGLLASVFAARLLGDSDDARTHLGRQMAASYTGGVLLRAVLLATFMAPSPGTMSTAAIAAWLGVGISSLDAGMSAVIPEIVGVAALPFALIALVDRFLRPEPRGQETGGPGTPNKGIEQSAKG